MDNYEYYRYYRYCRYYRYYRYYRCMHACMYVCMSVFLYVCMSIHTSTNTYDTYSIHMSSFTTRSLHVLPIGKWPTSTCLHAVHVFSALVIPSGSLMEIWKHGTRSYTTAASMLPESPLFKGIKLDIHLG